jgi:hypothetical protein
MKYPLLMIVGVASVCAGVGGCTPTIRVEVAPINIYAKLDADVRVRLDKEVQTAIQQNLFKERADVFQEDCGNFSDIVLQFVFSIFR